MKRLLVATLFALSTAVHASWVTGFNDPYAVSSWTQSPGTGSIDTSGAPNSVSLTSGDDAASRTSFTHFYRLFDVDATVRFSWNYTTTDIAPFYDPFGYVLANAESDLDAGFAQLTADFGPLSQSGTQRVFVQAGQYFGFSTFSDNFGGPATTVISGLRIISVPEPGALALVAVALLAAGAASRRRAD